MELQLYINTPIKEVKRRFSKYFPYLKIEFFTTRHSPLEGSDIREKVHEKLYLSEVTGVLKEGIFTFLPTDTVENFEQRLQNEHGLPVQVFRKYEKRWLITTETDKLSLEKQNAMGAASMRAEFNLHTLFL